VLCGSIYLNKRFRSALEKKLQGTVNLKDIEAEIDLAVNEFDETFKPTFNGTCRSHPFRIPGVPDDPEKGFKNDFVWFSASVSMGPSLGPFVDNM
jgi:hypothetical protein